MKTLKHNKSILLTAILTLILGFALTAQYTLTDDDVVVTDGIIDTCTYSFAITDIIIPDTLDEQLVTGIADKTYPELGVFEKRGITSVVLPSGILKIGDRAFGNNLVLTNLDFSSCTFLDSIGENVVFYSPELTNLDLSSCSLLSWIGANAFSDNGLSNIDLSGCYNLTSIGRRAFAGNALTNIDLSACLALNSIGQSAFTFNKIASLDFSGCTSLVSIGESSFRHNQLSILDLSNCTSLTSIGDKSFSYNLLSSVSLTSCTALTSIGEEAFKRNSISTLRVNGCKSLITIGPYAFTGNEITDVDFSGCDSLTTIGRDAFSNNKIAAIDFSDCDELTTIGLSAFYDNVLTSLDLSGCSSLKSIWHSAFQRNNLDSLDVSTCTTLNSIGHSAFRDNSLSGIDLTACSGLTFIGKGAFALNVMESFELPVNTKYDSYGWEDFYGTDWIGGGNTHDLWTFYFVPAPYTLSDEDVEVSEGIIQSCSYDYELGVITIPDTLDGQLITGIVDRQGGEEVFQEKGITKLVLPSSIVNIPDYAFASNSIKQLDISKCTALTSIGASAFRNNSIISLDLSACEAVEYIGNSAFSSNELVNLNVSSCAALTTIEEDAFSHNDLGEIDLTACTALTFIGENAFKNYIPYSFTLPVNAEYDTYGWVDANGNIFNGSDTVDDFETFYYVPAPYTITDNDVEITDGVIQTCTYDYKLRSIVIPDTLNGQRVTGIAHPVFLESGPFEFKGIIQLVLPSTIQIVGRDAFRFNMLTSVDLNNCGYLTNIGRSAFAFNSLTTLDLSACTSLTIIGDYAFRYNALENVDLSNCRSLNSIERSAFNENKITSIDLSSCTSLTSIGSYAFVSNELTSFQLPTPSIPGDEFIHWVDGYNNTFNGGDSVILLSTDYTAVFWDTSYTVTFLVSDATGPIQDAEVTLSNYGTLTTDDTGLAAFTNVSPEYDIPYAITASGYQDVNGTVSVLDTNIFETVTLDSIPSYSVNFNVSDGANPIQGASVTLTGYGTEHSDAGGQSIFKGVSPEDSLVYTVTATGYEEETGSIEVVDTDVTVSIFLLATGIANLSEELLSVYPNPANDVLNIELSVEGIYNIAIYSLGGQLICHSKIVGASHRIDLSSYRKGVYFITLRSNDFVITRKIIKQ